jgi:Holliday junction resolvase RusA-like endonuclease
VGKFDMDDFQEIKFTVAETPTAWARARSNGRIHFTAPKQRLAGQVVQTIAAEAMAGRPPLEGPLALFIVAIWCWPKSTTAKKRGLAGSHYKASRPDADNVAKIIGDALNGICYLDDAQVVELRILKQYGLSASTFISVSPMVPTP